MIAVSHLFAVMRPSGRSARSRCSRIAGPMFIFTGSMFLLWFCGRGSRINRRMTMHLGPVRYFTIALLSFRSVVNPVYIKMLIIKSLFGGNQQ